MNKKYILVIILVIILLFAGWFWYGNIQEKKEFEETRSQEKRSALVADLKKYNSELKKEENIKEVGVFAEDLVDNYYEWSVEEVDKSGEKEPSRYKGFRGKRSWYAWDIAEITGCAGYMDCFQYKVIKFEITKEELKSFMDEYSLSTVLLRRRIISDMEQTLKDIKDLEKDRSDYIERNDLSEEEIVDFDDRIIKQYEVIAHQIKVLQIVEALNIE